MSDPFLLIILFVLLCLREAQQMAKMPYFALFSPSDAFCCFISAHKGKQKNLSAKAF